MDPRILSNLGLPPNNYSGQSTSGMLMDLCEQLAGDHRSQLMCIDFATLISLSMYIDFLTLMSLSVY